MFPRSKSGQISGTSQRQDNTNTSPPLGSTTPPQQQQPSMMNGQSSMIVSHPPSPIKRGKSGTLRSLFASLGRSSITNTTNNRRTVDPPSVDDGYEPSERDMPPGVVAELMAAGVSAGDIYASLSAEAKQQQQKRTPTPSIAESAPCTTYNNIEQIVVPLPIRQKAHTSTPPPPPRVTSSEVITSSKNMTKEERLAARERRRLIRENFDLAMEVLPEAFARVQMLYIACTVNGKQFSAFVDTGAQMSILSKTAATRAGLDHLIDRRYGGTARGVGAAPISGRIHCADLEISGCTYCCAFTVIEASSIDLIFGLDMLMKHECHVDLKNHLLMIAGKPVKFLSEGEV